ncbi:TadE/TadG family type IV pilus assembly protein [Massilia glaciei]|nr:TadE family protein [Massilia glaciei]
MSAAVRLQRARRARGAKGSVAIELALIILLTFFLIPVVIMYGRAFMYYSAMKQASHDAARFMATMPLAQMLVTEREEAVEVVANQMIRRALAAAGIKASEITAVQILCDNPDTSVTYCNVAATGDPKPLAVTVVINVKYDYSLYGEIVQDFLLGKPNFKINAETTVPYAN